MDLDCSRIGELVSVNQILTANHLVTDPEGLFERTNVDSSPTKKMISGLQKRFDSFEVSREEDYFRVRNRGVLESLVRNRLRYECKNSNDLIHLTAYIMKDLAENQVFGDGNKRTAYLAGTMFLVKCQIDVLGRSEAVIPELDEELVSLLQELAVGEAEIEDLEKYLSRVEKDIENF